MAASCAAQCSFLVGGPSASTRPPEHRNVRNLIRLRASCNTPASRSFSGNVSNSRFWWSERNNATRIRHMSPAPRANKGPDDVPAFKGFPPMQTKPPWYWRVLALIPYIMPLCEAWMYAETAYNLHCFIEWYEFLTYPVLRLLGRLPSWFLLAYFFVAYLGIVRRNIWPHFFRFHVVTGMLLEIILQVMGTLNDWIPSGIYWGKIGAHFWLCVFWMYFLTTLETIRCAIMGMYTDIPFISDAAYMQIPYD